MNAAQHRRRRWLQASMGWAAAGGVAALTVRPARADPPEFLAALAAFSAGAVLREGRVTLEIAPLVDNGHLVPVSLRVQSPMTAADHVQELALFTEKNPAPDVARFQLTPGVGVARVDTRIRLATSQQVAAVARMGDGSCWVHRVEVVVVLAACIE
jgi:sulfur-oxidizing protein SoxY